MKYFRRTVSDTIPPQSSNPPLTVSWAYFNSHRCDVLDRGVAADERLANVIKAVRLRGRFCYNFGSSAQWQYYDEIIRVFVVMVPMNGGATSVSKEDLFAVIDDTPGVEKGSGLGFLKPSLQQSGVCLLYNEWAPMTNGALEGTIYDVPDQCSQWFEFDIPLGFDVAYEAGSNQVLRNAVYLCVWSRRGGGNFTGSISYEYECV